MTSVLETRPSLELTLFAVTLMAIVWLTLIVAHLHARVRRLEQARTVTSDRPAYGYLVGRSLGHAVPSATDVLLVLSARCRSCERLLNELADTPWHLRAAILWKDGVAAAGVRIPESVAVITDTALSAELGVSVTPFALELDSFGTVTRAGPIGNLANLARGPAFSAAAR